MRQRQQGLTLIGLLFFSAIAVVFIYFFAILVPSYMDYWAVKRIVAQLQSSATSGDKSDAELRNEFERQLNVDYVTAVSGRDLVIDRDRRQGVNVYIEWSVKKPFVGNISLNADFKAGNPPAE